MAAASRNSDAYCLSLLGKPWVSGARGPEAFDCWGLLVAVYAACKGVTLPCYPGIEEVGAVSVARMLENGIQAWRPLGEPENLCGVGLSAGKHIHHVGLWLDLDGGGVLHCASGRGVTFQNPASLRNNGLSCLTFYAYDSSPPLH